MMAVSCSKMFLWSWGANSHGQLGLGTTSEQVEKPTKVDIELQSNANDNKIEQIACGGGHTLLADTAGTLYTCGWNLNLQLGTEGTAHSFKIASKLTGVRFEHVACGWNFSCGVKHDHYLYVWGSNSHGQLGIPKSLVPKCDKPVIVMQEVNAVSMGLRHTAIINSKGEVWITGCGRHGQLGLGVDKLSSEVFEKVLELDSVSHISCGQNHTVAWSSEKEVLYIWGDNKHGQLLLCNKKHPKVYTPKKLHIEIKQGVKKLLSGWSNVLLWLKDGSILTWGKNNFGQLGTNSLFTTGQTMNVELPGGRQVKDIAVGSEHTICLATDNTLWAWGWNEHGNTGIVTGEGKNILVPTLIPFEISPNITIRQIYAGGAHNFVVTEEQVFEDRQE